MRSVALLSAAALAVVLSAPASAQVMARGYYNHVDSRVSFFIPGVTQVGQVKIEDITYNVEGFEPKPVAAKRFTHTDAGGTRFTVTSIDFKPAYERHDSTVQGSMAAAAAEYRRKGEIIYDAGTRTDRIPAQEVNVRLPNGRILYTLFILHQDDVLDQRRLVIAEAETAPRARQPGLFLASIGIINPQFFGTTADHTLWRVRYSPAGPPIQGAELVATQPWGTGQFLENMSAGGEAVPGAAGAPAAQGGRGGRGGQAPGQ
jgi:hypothetical protein